MKIFKFITAFTLSFILLFNVSAENIAQESLGIEGAEPISNYQDGILYKDIELTFKNAANRYALGLFGRDAAVAFLGDSVSHQVSEEVRTLDYNGMGQYIAPIPISISKIINTVFAGLYICALFFASYKISQYYLEHGLTAISSEGQKKFNPKPAFLFVAAIFFVLPTGQIGTSIFSGKQIEFDNIGYSPLHELVFAGLGKSFRLGDELQRRYMSASQVFFPVYIIPKPVTLTEEMEKLLDFGICINSYISGYSSQQFSIKSQLDNNIYKINQTVGNCSLNIAVSLDEKTTTLLKNDKLSRAAHIKGDDYKQLQVKTLDNLFRDTVTQSIQFGAATMQHLKQSDTHTISKLRQVTLDRTKWYNSCPKNIAELATRPDVASIAASKRQAASCLSLQATERLSYPADLPSKLDEKLTQDGFLLPNRQRELCSLATDDDLLTSASTEGIQDCAKRTCSLVTPDGARSGLFECSVALNTLNKYQNFEHNLDRGFLLAAPTYINSLDLSGLPESPKILLNSLTINTDIDYNYSDLSVLAIDTAANFSTRLGVNNIAVEINKNDSYNTEKKTMLFFDKYDDVTVNLINEPEYTAKTTSSFNNNEMMMLMSPVKKMVTCLSHPNQMLKNIGPCYEPLVEIRALGKKMIYAYATINGARYTTKLARMGQNFVEKTSKGAGVSEAKKEKVKSFSSNGFKAAVTAGASFIAANELLEVYTKYTTRADAFSYQLDTSFFESSPTLMLIGYAIATEEQRGSSSMWSTLLFIGLALPGFMFAYVIPLLPLVIFGIAVLGLLMKAVVSLAQIIFVALNMSISTDNDLSKSLKKGVVYWIELMFRPVMLLAGLFLSLFMMETLMPIILNNNMIATALNGGTYDELSFLQKVLELLIYMLLVLFIVYMCLDLTTSLKDYMKSVLLGEELSVDGKNDTAGAMGKNKNVVDSIKADSNK